MVYIVFGEDITDQLIELNTVKKGGKGFEKTSHDITTAINIVFA